MLPLTRELVRFPLPGHPGYHFSNVHHGPVGFLNVTLCSPEGKELVSIGARYWTDQEGPHSGIYSLAETFLSTTMGYGPKAGPTEIDMRP